MSSNSSKPGRFLPPIKSKNAPPPVDMWFILFLTFAFEIAATESPPPIMLVLLFKDAISFAILIVPFEKFSISYIPSGPFQNIVFVFFAN